MKDDQFKKAFFIKQEIDELTKILDTCRTPGQYISVGGQTIDNKGIREAAMEHIGDMIEGRILTLKMEFAEL